MHAIGILHRCLSPLLKHMHARRLATLLEAVASCVNGPALSLTDVGRRCAGEALLRVVPQIISPLISHIDSEQNWAAFPH